MSDRTAFPEVPLLPRHAFTFCLLVALLGSAPPAAAELDLAAVEITKTVPTSAVGGDGVGTWDAVAIDGDWAVLGAPGHGLGGAVFVLHRAGDWGVLRTLTASDAASGDGFGESVAIYDGVIAVGAPNVVSELPSRFDAGAVYIFERDAGGLNNWGETKKLVSAVTIIEGDRFGSDVAVGTDRVLVGVPQTNTGHTGAGEAQLFGRNVGGVDAWGLEKRMLPSDGLDNDGFGTYVDLSGSTAAIGAPFRYPDKKLYLYEEDLGGTDNWGEKLVAPQSAGPGTFGQDIAIQGDTLAAGHHRKVEIFGRDVDGAGNWGGVKVIDPGTTGSFGSALDLDGDLLLVGDLADTSARGKAFLYERNEGGADQWGLLQDLTASDGASTDYFAAAVAVDADTMVIGAPQDDDHGSATGAGYVFQLLPAADVTITKTNGVSTVVAGEVTTYTIQVSNQSSADLTDLVVTDTFTSGNFDYPASSWTCAPDGGSTAATSCPVNGTGVDFNSGVSVDVGASESLSFSYDALPLAYASGTATNQVTVALPSGIADPAPGDNTAVDSDSLVSQADLSLSVTPSASTVVAGEQITFQVELASAGPSQGSVRVDGTFPPELTFESYSLPNRGEGVSCYDPYEEERGSEPTSGVRCIDNLSAGHGLVVDVVASVDVAATGLVTSDWEGIFQSGSDPEPSDNTVTVETTVEPPPEPPIFGDDFESGSTDSWSSVVL